MQGIGERAVVGSGKSKILSYDGSKNGAEALIVDLTGSATTNSERFSVDHYAGLCALAYVDAVTGGRLLIVGTLSGTVITWGTPYDFGASIDGNAMEVVVLSATKVATVVREASKIQIQTFNVASNNLTLDATNVSMTAVGSFDPMSIMRDSSTRFLLQYIGTSAYPSIIGITVGAGTITPDASAFVIATVATPLSNFALRKMSAGVAMAVWATSSPPYGYRALFTYTSSLVDRAPSPGGDNTQCTDVSTSAMSLIAGDGCGVATGSETGGIYVFALSGTTFSSEKFANSNAAQLSRNLITKPAVGSQDYVDLKGAWFGEVDGDDIMWGAFSAVGYTGADNKVGVTFIGINPANNPIDKTLIQVAKDVATTSQPIRSSGRCVRLVGIDINTFLIVYFDGGNNAYRYLVGKI